MPKGLQGFQKGNNFGTQFQKGDNLGKLAWNKGLTKDTDNRLKKISEKMKGGYLTKNIRKKISETNKKIGKTPPRKYWFKKGCISWSKGEKLSEKIRKKISKKQKKLKKWVKEKNPNWKGGISSKNLIARKNIEIRLWRESVFARDNYICQKCGDKKGGNLNAHHIKNFAQHPELRTSIENGITLCEKCHNEFHKKYGFKNNNKKQIKKFLK